MLRGPEIFTLVLLTTMPLLAPGQTVPVPESIRAENVPPIPTSLSTALNRYQNIRLVSFQDWDDSRGRAMYVTTRFADTPQVHHVAVPGGARRQLTFFNERVLNVSARPKHDQFLYAMDEGGAENYQLFLQDRAGGEPRRITDGKSRNIAPAWSPSGELSAWSCNARNGRDMDLYLAAPADTHFQRRFKEVSGQWTVADWSPDETRVAAEEYVSDNESYIHIIEIGSGQTTTITPRRASPTAEPVFSSEPKWSQDGKSIYYITDKGSEFRRLLRHDLVTGSDTVITANIPWDVESYDLSDDGQLVALVANEDGIDVLHGYSAATGQEFPVRKFPRGQISGLKFRQESHELGLSRSSTQEASDAYSVLIDNVGLDRWTESETGGLDTLTFAEPSLIQYRTFDGRQIPAFVYRPATARFSGRRPVLIEIHGGPESQFCPGRFRGWKVCFPGQRPLATPAVVDGRVFVGGGFGGYEFYALDARSGDILWEYQTSDDGPTAAVVDQGFVVFNTESCELEVLTVEGSPVWKKWLGDPLMSMPAVGVGRIFMAYPDSRGDHRHYLACFDLRTGTEFWKQPIGGGPTQPTMEG